MDDLCAVLEEFIEDVEAVGVLEVEKDWPDLVETYRKARAVLGLTPLGEG